VNLLSYIGLIWACSALVMLAGWMWQRARSNAGIVDVIWAGALGGSAILLATWGAGAWLTRVILAVLGGVWGFRLAAHLWARVRREPEDGRYRYLRAHWQGSQLKWFGFFQFQALLVALFALPFWVVAQNSAARPIWLASAILIWILSVAGESLADAQLARFRARAENRGRTCQEGLWRYSRHPNYFFEWLHWFTYVALAQGSPYAWAALSGPLVMFVFLRYVSGVPFTEAQALRSRGEEYRRYQARTRMFFPWFPRRRDERT
jgi:steroid 5-alpha reductase family enzyme